MTIVLKNGSSMEGLQVNVYFREPWDLVKDDYSGFEELQALLDNALTPQKFGQSTGYAYDSDGTHQAIFVVLSKEMLNEAVECLRTTLRKLKAPRSTFIAVNYRQFGDEPVY